MQTFNLYSFLFYQLADVFLCHQSASWENAGDESPASWKCKQLFLLADTAIHLLVTYSHIYICAYGIGLPWMCPSLLSIFAKNLKQQHGGNILGCDPIDGVLGVLSSNQINIASFLHQMVDVCIPSGGKK